MDKLRPCPGNIAAGMAGIALGIGCHVVRCLAKRIGKKEVATVTTRTVTRSDRPNRTCMAHRCYRAEGGKDAVAVAGIALSGRRNVRGRFAECRRTVVAG